MYVLYALKQPERLFVKNCCDATSIQLDEFCAKRGSKWTNRRRRPAAFDNVRASRGGVTFALPVADWSISIRFLHKIRQR